MLAALTTLYEVTAGAGWKVNTNWLGAATADPCTGRWYGIYCVFGAVLRVELNKNRMTGTLPTELALLGGELKGSLDLFGNVGLSGTIPTELGLLTAMNTGLLLHENDRLSGTLPPQLSQLGSLQYLYAHSDPRLSGTIPSELGSLTNMRKLYLHGDTFSGTVPSELARLTPDECATTTAPRACILPVCNLLSKP